MNEDSKKDLEYVDFLTTYRQDFKGIMTARDKMVLHEDTPEIITIAFQDVLLPEKYKYTKKTFDLEPTSDYYKRLMNEIPSLNESIESEPNKDVLENFIAEESKTTVQHDYQWKGFENDYQMGFHLRTDLPENWSIPKTSNQRSYRDFGSIINYNLKTEPVPLPHCNLDPNPALQKILQVKTGETDYQRNIGRLGEDIIREQFYGKILDPSELPH